MRITLKEKENEKENIKNIILSEKEDLKSKGVMIKYQLIFIKVEIFLNNFAKLFQNKENRIKKICFDKIQLYNYKERQGTESE